ncbi:MAG: DUF2312 domain-containing protein [Alphaproteobacteria bacterium]|jgi:uncharacterized protein (UPF0335 family)|nr:DUF2312 domain-containing protein [Alphaproteobacteria bacterium]
MEQQNIGGISAGQLKSFMEKIENLEQDKAELLETIRDVFAEAKSEGFDVKVMRQLLKMRRMKKEELAEQEELLDLYRQALGE